MQTVLSHHHARSSGHFLGLVGAKLAHLIVEGAGGEQAWGGGVEADHPGGSPVAHEHLQAAASAAADQLHRVVATAHSTTVVFR